MNAGVVVARLLEFEAPETDALVEQALREAAAAATAAPGLRRLIVAEGEPALSGRRMALLTIWRDEASMLSAVADGNVPVYHVALARYLGSANLSTFEPEPASLRLPAEVVQSISITHGADPNVVDEPGATLLLVGPVDDEPLAVVGFAEPRRAGGTAFLDRLLRGGSGPSAQSTDLRVTVDLIGDARA